MSKKRPTKRATVGEKIAANACAKCYTCKMCEIGKDLLRKHIDSAIKRAVREATNKTAWECVNMYFEARGVHHFEEMIQQRFGVKP